MKHVSFFLCLLLSLFVHSQEPADSAFLTELEDSVSAMAIKPVKHPEELLMMSLQRLEKDTQRKHSRREYLLNAVFCDKTPAPLSVSRMFSVEGDDGIDILNRQYATMGPLSMKGTYSQFADSTSVEFSLSCSNLMHFDVRGSKWTHVEISKAFAYYGTPKEVCKGILKVYDVTAYRIGDASGRGVYRIHFDEKKSMSQSPGFENRKMKWYLEGSSLRLIQINEDRYMDKFGQRTLYRRDFEEEEGAPVLNKSIEVRISEGIVVRRTEIRLKRN